jgi:DNA primase
MTALMNDAVQQIKDKLNIIDVLTPYIELQKAGKHLKARCPFHNEKTPSFNVSPERGMYHCYGCGAGGDMFTFVQAIEGVDFRGALKILAEKANVELVPVSPQKKSERDRLYAVLEDATTFYQSLLPEATEVRRYLEKRGVSEVTIATWRIGFVPGPPQAGWGVVKEHLQGKGYTEAELFKAGLIKASDKGKDSYDVFRNRLMFPLFDQSGRVVGFSGRTMETGPDVPKYVNSPETDLYKKSELLYGYDKAKQGIRQLDFSLIVEGQFDVIMSHQAKYANTVAVSGTALTPHHVQMLERLSHKVVLALDSDKAGIAAMKRAADLMLRRGLDVKVALLTGGKDPADMVLKDVKEYRHAIGQSVHVIDFLIKILAEQNLDERTFKLRASEEIVPYILLLPNHIDQDHFEGKLAEALKTTKEAVHYEVDRLRDTNKEQSERREVIKQPVTTSRVVKQETIKQHEALLTYVVGVLPLFEEEVANRIKAALEEILHLTFGEIDEKVAATVRAEVLFRTESFLDKNPRKVFNEEFIYKLNKLREMVIRVQLKESKEQQRDFELAGNEEGWNQLSSTIGELSKLLQVEPYSLDLLRLQ